MLPPQTVPHLPQFRASVLRLVSQPSPEVALQSPKGALHAPITHRLLAHEAAALANAQTLPQVPQLATLFVRLSSQPLAALPSQLPKPPLHAPRVQTPFTQLAPALVKAHTLP